MHLYYEKAYSISTKKGKGGYYGSEKDPGLMGRRGRT
jgi:hypothetical protein